MGEICLKKLLGYCPECKLGDKKGISDNQINNLDCYRGVPIITDKEVYGNENLEENLEEIFQE